MNLMLGVAIFLAAATGLTTFFLTRRRGRIRIDALNRELGEARTELASAKAGFVARDEELRSQIKDARDTVNESSQRLEQLAGQLRAELEEKGRLQSTSARLEEVKTALLERDQRIELLNGQVIALERGKTEATKDAEAANKRAIEVIANERDANARVLKGKDDQIEKLNEFISQAREVLTTEFKALSADAINDARTQLLQEADKIIDKHTQEATSTVGMHREQIATLLKPVEETMKRLDKHVEDSNLARANAETLLTDHIDQLKSASESLSNALRKPVVRGSWAEKVLEDALEGAGLVSDIDFVLQHTTDGEDGRKRTDAVVNMPKGRKLVIDSKNLMESYIAYANAEDDIERMALAEEHSKRLTKHLRALWDKKYWDRYEGLDCVFLFIPHDGMYHAAIRDEAELIREASEKRVFLCNPMTLVPLLRAIRYVLDQDRLNKNAEEIKTVGADLYAEVTRFAEHLATLGERLRSTVKAYNEAIPGLDRFIVSKSRKLKELGCWKGDEADLPETLDVEPRLFSSEELRNLDNGCRKAEEVA